MRLLALFFLITFAACDSTPLNTNAGNILKDSITGLTQFYPIPSFIKEELQYVEDFPTGIMQYTTYGPTGKEKVDSGYISLDSLKRFALLFESTDLNLKSIRKKVKESSFFDQSIDLVTLNYEIADEKIPLSKVVVTIKKGDLDDTVNSIYIEKSEQFEGQACFLKLYWKTHKSCLIIAQWLDSSGAEQIKQINLVWNKEEG